MSGYTIISRPPVETPVALRLAALSLDRVEFDLVDTAGHVVRHATVLVGSARNSTKALRFPNLASQDGESAGDELLDELIRVRAAEELVRMQGTLAAAESWTRAA